MKGRIEQDFLTAADHRCDHLPIEVSTSLEHAAQLWEAATTCRLLARDHQRWLALNDLYILARYLLGAAFLEHPWLFARAKEIEGPDDREGHLDLWFRGAGKSTLQTWAMNIQDILRDPEIRIGIFSYARPIAKAFLRQIKHTLETNEALKQLFPDILYQNPKTQSPTWGQNDGITVIRKGSQKESTVEAWGLIDEQPTSRHMDLLDFDDPISIRHADPGSDAMPEKVERGFEMALGLGSRPLRFRYKSVPFDAGDLSDRLIQKRFAPVRLHGAIGDDGEPVVHSQEEIADLRRRYGPKRFALQYLCRYDVGNVVGEGFRREWLRYYRPEDRNVRGLNLYILVDSSSGSRQRQTDFTAMWVIGLSADSNIYALEIVRDKLTLTQRVDLLFDLHRRYRPLRVGYESYGMMGDLDAIEDRMGTDHYHFDLQRLGGKLPKRKRIERLFPYFESGRIYLPETLLTVAIDGSEHDAVEEFVNLEYLPFPYSRHTDLLDSLARLCDPEMKLAWPVYHSTGPSGGSRFQPSHAGGSWMTA